MVYDSHEYFLGILEIQIEPVKWCGHKLKMVLPN